MAFTYMNIFCRQIFIGLLCGLVITCFSERAISQLAFQSYTMEQGLSQNSVYCITQSPDRLLWLGTNYGLNSFDGQNFVQFLPKTSDGKPLSAVIQALAIYKNEYLLLGTNNEFLFFHLPTSSFLSPEKVFSNLQLAEGASPRKILVDNQQNIWIMTLNHGLYFYNVKENFLKRFENSKGIILNFTDIALTTTNKCYAATDEQLFSLEKNSIKQILFSHKPLNIKAIIQISDDELLLASRNYGLLNIKLGLNENKSKIVNISLEADIVKLFQASDTSLWVGTRTHGISKVDLKSGKTLNDKAEKSISSIKKNYVLCLFEDKAKNVWLGLSGGGLAKYLMNEKVFEIIKYPSTASFNDNMTFSISSSDGDNYYFGTLTGGLVQHSRSKKKFIYHQAPNLPIEVRNIYDIEDQGNVLWLATWAGLCSFDKLKGNFVLYSGKSKLFTIKVLKERNLILASGEYGLSCFNLLSKTWKPCNDSQGFLTKHNLVSRHIEQLNRSELGLATLNRNFIKYNLDTGHFTEYPAFQAISLSSRYFFQNKEDLWIATDNGLIQANTATMQTIKFWTQQNGLANDFIYSVLPDAKGNIWLTHNRGLSKLDLEHSQITNFSLKDGLQDMEFNSASCHKTKDGKLLFGGINGVNFIDVNKIKPKNYAIEPIITDIKVLNEPIKHSLSVGYIANLNLKTEENSFSIDFIAPNPHFNNDLKYRYRLVGLDPTWVEAGLRTYANFGHLAPGAYSFEVKSYDTQGNESAAKALKIEIAQPIWQRLWFILSVLVLVSAVIAFWLKYRLKIIRKRHQNQLQLADLETKAVQLQLNSHFIFNSLSLISQLVTNKENNEANQFLVKFANVIRHKLGQSRSMLVPFTNELDYISEYIEIEKKRFAPYTILEFGIEINQNIDINKIIIPSNTLQPLLEKAIWHYEYQNAEIRQFRLIIFEKNASYCCVLYGNCKDQKPKKAVFDEINIENIQKRIALINESLGHKYRLQINEIQEKELALRPIFEFYIPKNNYQNKLL